MPKQEEINSSFDKINDEYTNKECLGETIKKTFPKQLIPTKKTNIIFGLIFATVLIIAIIQFPFDQILSGNLDMVITVGYPWNFLEFDLSNTKNSPFLLLNLILDLILYIILAYAMDIILNLTFKNTLLKSKEEIKQQPMVFKNQKPTLAEKVTKKVFEKSNK